MARVSVVMACFNAMPYLPAAVDSIVNQTYQDWQLVIVNDGSTDDSGRYLEERNLADPRIIVVRQENQGQQAAANKGISMSDSEFIARMDADDVSDVTRLEKQVSFMDDHLEVGLLGGQLVRMGQKKSGLISNLPLAHEPIVSGLLKNHHTMCNPTVIFRRRLFEKIGGYWKHNISEDWDMFLRMAEISKLANLKDCLLSYRLHTQSINGRRIIEAQLFNEYAAELYKLRATGKPEISFEEFKRRHRSNRWPQSWQFYLDALSIGQYREAVAELYNGQRLLGYSRIGLSMLMSPTRSLRRVINMSSRK